MFELFNGTQQPETQSVPVVHCAAHVGLPLFSVTHTGASPPAPKQQSSEEVHDVPMALHVFGQKPMALHPIWPVFDAVAQQPDSQSLPVEHEAEHLDG